MRCKGDNLYVFNTERPGNPCDPDDPPDVGLAAPVRVNSLMAAGEHLYVDIVGESGDYHEAVLQAFGTTNPRQPDALGSLPLPARVTDWYWSDGRLYVADSDRGLRIIDSSDPTRLALIGVRPGRQISSHLSGDLGEPRLAIGRSRAFLTAGEYGIEVLSIVDPSAPMSLGFAAIPEEYPAGVAASGDFLLVAAGLGGLWISAADALYPRPIEGFQ